MRPGCLAAPDGLPAPDRSAVPLDSTVVRVHAGAAGVPQNKGTDHALGRSRGGFGTQIPDPCPGGSPRPAPAPARDGRPAPRPHPGPCPGEAWTVTPRPCLMADRAYEGDAFRAWRAQRGTEAVIPARKGRTNPPAPRPRTVQGAQGRGTGPRLAQGVAARGHPLRPNTRIGAWVFCTWSGPGSGCNPTSTRPSTRSD